MVWAPALRFERLPDSVQTNHIDWGFRSTTLYGIDYRWTTSQGWFSEQLLVDCQLALTAGVPVLTRL